MKTNKQNSNKQIKPSTINTQQSTNSESELKNRTEQSSTESESVSENPKSKLENQKSIKPYVDYALRERNRQLPSERVLEILKRWNPAQYKLAEVVGNWIWITFPEAPIERVRAELSQLGFHWNNKRQAWQHPCGKFTFSTPQNPREKYGSRFAADAQTA